MPAEAAPPPSLFGQVRWSLAFVAFVVYIYVITSYRVPVGTVAMSTALLALPLERNLRFAPPMAWAALLFAWALVGSTTTEYPTVVADALLDFAKVCAVFFVALNVLTTRARFRFFIVVFLGTFALYPVRGALFSYFIYHGNILGRAAWNYIYSNPNDLAAFCILQFSLAAGVAVVERKGWIRLAAIVGAGLLPFVILLTGSRGGFLALFAFGLIAFRKQITQFKKIALTLVIGIIIVVAIPNNIWHRLSSIQEVSEAKSTHGAEEESSTVQRLEIWKVAKTIATENPVFGVGLGAYEEAHFRTAQRPEFDRTAYGHRSAHSTYLSMAAELGVPGLILFLGLVVSILLDAERTRRKARATHPKLATQLFYMEVGIIAYFVAGIWGSLGTLAITFVHLAVVSVASRLLKEDLSPNPHSKGGWRLRAATMRGAVPRRSLA